MSYQNQLDRDQVCICPREMSYLGQFGGYVLPRYHQDDCPFFEDTSSGQDADYQPSNEAEYVF